MNIVTVVKTENAAVYLPKIDDQEADAEFFNAAAGNEDNMHVICVWETVVGLAQVIHGRTAFAYVYIFPEYRHRGYGQAAAALIEWQLRGAQSARIMTSYRSTDEAARLFATRCGFQKQFSSDYMIYTGAAFAPTEDIVRAYRDADYPEAHALYAEAFHRMRLATGCFPDSVPEAPSERMRTYWSETADERLICMYGDEIVGYAHVEGMEIGSISVKPEMQGKGIGRQFLKAVMNRILAEYEMVSLYCVVGNYKARSLYDSIGFAAVCRNDYAVKKL